MGSWRDRDAWVLGAALWLVLRGAAGPAAKWLLGSLGSPCWVSQSGALACGWRMVGWVGDVSATLGIDPQPFVSGGWGGASCEGG